MSIDNNDALGKYCLLTSPLNIRDGLNNCDMRLLRVKICVARPRFAILMDNPCRCRNNLKNFSIYICIVANRRNGIITVSHLLILNVNLQNTKIN